MRYYNFALYASAEQIKEKTKINLREYAYENTYVALNNYMYKRLDNYIYFYAYREEGNTTFAVYAYDEKKVVFADSFVHVTDVLKGDFSITRMKAEPCEITMYQALDFLLEARRRNLMDSTNRLIEASNLWIYNYYNNEKLSFYFKFDERIVPDKSSCRNAIYDQSFINELTNIEEYENASDFKGNMVHYVISGRSNEAVRNLIDRALQNQAVRLLPTGKDVNDLKKNELFKIIKDDISLLEEGLKDERKAGTAKQELENMIGLAYVKKIIDKALAHYKLNKLCIDKGLAIPLSIHSLFNL